jgi:lipopolysaccharide export system protein LptA
VTVRALFTATLLALAGAGLAPGQSLEEPKLPRLDIFGGKRLPLGYEGTPIQKKKPKEEKKPKGQTEITALEATFDQKTREAVFIGNVLVKDPEFTVNCDRLTAVLKKQQPQEEAAPKSALPADPPPGVREEPAAEPKGGGLDHAIAEAAKGNEVIITQDKFEADGTITKNVGKAKKATYDAKTGDIVLTGSPSVQQGINLCIAQSEETVMTLNRNGRMRVEGPHKTVIKDTNTADAIR